MIKPLNQLFQRETKLMKKTFTILLSFITLFADAQSGAAKKLHQKSVAALFEIETDKIFDRLVTIRRSLHQHPELAGKEIQTQQVIKQYLMSLGMEVDTTIYGYGVVGILKGKKRGKKIAWRADMDALPNDFPDNVDFKSTEKGVQHGCGHDVHLTIALGIAEILSKHRDKLKGTVYFIFQPEEETFVGAKKMIDNGLFSRIKPDELYGLHVTALPVGQIMVKQNELFAHQRGIRIALKNALSKEAITALTQKIAMAVSRIPNGSKPWEVQSILDPTIGLANPNTIFKDYCFVGGDFINYTKQDTVFLEADVYETNQSNLANIISNIRQTILTQNNGEQLLGVSFFKENPTVINDPQLTTNAVKVFEQLYGKGSIASAYGQVPFFNDDFAFYQQKTPGVYFFFGGSNFEKGIVAMNHAPNFMVDESCIKIGVRSFAAFIFNQLNSK
jgi:metal-dependent amidase/aminoacylase/carboxypeptidase family protein